jgi:DNA invertase Pin-like site-specific DNA recombinase
LADFAKLVELFDEHAVSFVSVTQQFNTTTCAASSVFTRQDAVAFATIGFGTPAGADCDRCAAAVARGVREGGFIGLRD